uniref:Probable 6-phosphogluconolactonase n=1 Tax=Lonicera caerulea TaxID=134520 RepID=A0A9E9JTT9_9DIPS|nr:bHLH13 [Lonicera caerulea]
MARVGKKILEFDSEQDVAVDLSTKISELSAKYIKEKGYFTVVLSGGTLIDTLRKLVEKRDVDWSKWIIFFLDERVVPLTVPDSNYKLAYDGFLSKVGIPKSNIYSIKEKVTPEEAADDYEARLKQLVANKTLPLSPNGFPIFDLMLVGMGPEGHVASLFCWHFQRYETQRWITFIKASPKPPAERITMTFPVINASKHIAMVVTGKEVADAVKVALHESDRGFAYIPLPVQMVSPTNGELTWYLDKDALSKMQGGH